MSNLKNYKDFLFESHIEKLILECEDLINESDLEKNNSEYDNMSVEELEEICETMYQKLIEDKELFSDWTELDEDAANPGPVGPSSAIKAVKSAVSLAQAVTGKSVVSVASTAAASLGIAGTLAAVSAGAVIVGAGYLLYKYIAKRKAMKQALAKMPEGTAAEKAKKDMMREKLRKMTKAEIEQYDKIQSAKAMSKGAKDLVKGENNPPENEAERKGYEEGRKLGEEAKKKAEELKKLPDEEKEKAAKEIQSKSKEAKAKAEKAKTVISKLKELQPQK